MIRLLWLFLILDVALSAVFVASDMLGSQSAGENFHEISMRILIELAALAIIEAVREIKV